MLLFALNEETNLAFDQIVDAYEKRVFNLIYRLIGNYDEAADLTQDTFVAAYRGYGRFRFECGVYSWLCRIAVNHCKNRYRERDRRGRFEGASLDDELTQPAAYASPRPSPDREVEQKELRELIEGAIAGLPDDYRIVVTLRDLQGLSYQEITEVTELSLDNVRVRLSRARGMIRRKLGPYLDSQTP